MLDFVKNKLWMLDTLPDSIASRDFIPVELTGSGISLRVDIDKKTLHLILDTGATHSTVFYERIPNAKLKGCRLIDKSDLELDCNTAIVTLTNSEKKKINIPTLVINHRMSEDIDFDGLIGMTFLRGHKVILDMSAKNMYLSR